MNNKGDIYVFGYSDKSVLRCAPWLFRFLPVLLPTDGKASRGEFAMIRLALILALFCLSVGLRAEDSCSFAGLKWGASKDDVTKQLRAQGFMVDYMRDGNLHIDGTLAGYKARGLAMFGRSGLAKVGIALATPEAKALDVYKGWKSRLTKKYGNPERSYPESARANQDEGLLKQAIRKGSQQLLAMWKEPAAQTVLAIRVTEQLELMVIYEAPSWDEERTRRGVRTISMSDFGSR